MRMMSLTFANWGSMSASESASVCGAEVKRPMGFSVMKFDVPPVIVIGMHRSGTSLVSSLLQELKVHMGLDVTKTEESVSFRALNQRLLRRASATWYSSEPMWCVLEDSDRVKRAAQQLRFDCDPNALEGYGWSADMQAWGWKDPRTTLTLPIWLELFPEARVVHVVRNGVDVAASLFRRSRRTRSLGKRLRFWTQVAMGRSSQDGKQLPTRICPCGAV